ncbi:MAG: ABC transporter ATP-binding protein, partial [Bacteroidales bacterium]|nr:ABC transporter ATP-binding protein [Bacteroidales bacterium]
MKEFWKVIKRYIAPYRKYIFGSALMNVLAAVFTIFSFTPIIPILGILFKTNAMEYEFIAWDADLK